MALEWALTFQGQANILFSWWSLITDNKNNTVKNTTLSLGKVKKTYCRKVQPILWGNGDSFMWLSYKSMALEWALTFQGQANILFSW